MANKTRLGLGKRAYILKLVQDIRASYWFLPSVLVFAGLGLAGVMGWIDTHADDLPLGLPDTFVDTQADGARATLSVIAQSIIGVTGVMFSMTLVAVSFAAGNFGPRLIGNFMRDRGNQWSLGILIATFVYALVVLRTVQDGIDDGVAQYVPQYSLIMAVFLSLVCVFTLIYFIHHVPETINVTRIAAGIGLTLEDQIRTLIDDRDSDSPQEGPTALPDRRPDSVIAADTTGYIQTINFTLLEKLAEDNNWFVTLEAAVGDFLTSTTEVFHVWSDDPLSDDDQTALSACYAVGISKTENQNPTFLGAQLVEMVARALSPGVNDPYTAIDCLNRMAAGLTVASTYKKGLQAPDMPRVRFDHLTFKSLFAATFPLCRQYIRPDAMVLAHAKTLLTNLAEVAQPDERPLIEEELEKLTPAD